MVQRRVAAQAHPQSALENDGSCWTCVARGTRCDKGLPGTVSRDKTDIDCQICAQGGYVCEGYATRLHWNNNDDQLGFFSNGDFSRKRRRSSNNDSMSRQFPELRRPSYVVGYIPEDPIITASTTTIERRYLRHFLTHVCRVSTAIDNESNGLRNTILPMSAADPALLNTILAVSSSHMGTWENRVDPKTQTFLDTAVLTLRKNLANPIARTNQATIATIFLLSVHEIFNASTSKWRVHLRGAANLIRHRGGSADLHPVIKRNLFMLDLQSALNCGEGFFFESEVWMQEDVEMKRVALESRPDWPISAVELGRREACVIDPLLGTSVKLLSVMVSSSNF